MRGRSVCNAFQFSICIIIWTGAEVPEDKNTTPATGTLFLLLIMTLVWSSSLFFS